MAVATTLCLEDAIDVLEANLVDNGKRRLCTVCTLFISPVVSVYFCLDLRTHRRALLP